MPDENADNEDLAEELIAALEAADEAPLVITARVDRAVSDMATAHFRGRRSTWRRPTGWAALAASVALVAVLVVQFGSPVFEAETSLYADVDGSGRIDIADVLAVARTEGSRVSQAELDAFAMRVVALDAGAS